MKSQWVVFLALAAVACSGSVSDDGTSDKDNDPNESDYQPPQGESATLSEFVDEFYDPTACDSFVPCGDEVSGRFRYDSFKVCAESDTDVSQIEEGLQDLCTEGVSVEVVMDIDMEIEISGGSCSGYADVAAYMVLEMTDSCISEATGTSLSRACPQLEAALQSEVPGSACGIVGDVCSCSMQMYDYTQGSCAGFVLDSACLDGDTLTFSDSEGIWVLTRVDGTSETSDGLSIDPLPPLEGAGLKQTASPLSSPPKLLDRFSKQRSKFAATVATAVRSWR